jgi:hypothetical protein
VRKVWIEAALNGAWTRALQPGIPDTIEAIIAEGVACARAGATIIHTHAYDGGGPQTFDWQVHARIIEGIPGYADEQSRARRRSGSDSARSRSRTRFSSRYAADARYVIDSLRNNRG